MKYKRILALLVTVGILLLGTSQVTGQQDEPQSPQGSYGSAFTYQGQLNGPGGPVDGQCDLRFKLWDAASGGDQVGWTWLLEGVEIVDGLFTARLDFGSVHDGSARWLEVAVRCPAGGGDYITLGPRQELTAAPAAHSLVLPFYAEANIGGPLVSFVNTSGDGEAALFSSQGAALWVESAGLDGLYVASAGQNGVRVVDAGAHGLEVDSAGTNGVHVNTASANGMHINTAGDDGVFVGAAGNPSTVTHSENANGVEVGGAQGHGLYVGRADEDGVFVESAGGSGFYVGSALRDGLVVGSASWTGAIIGMVGWDGVAVAMAGNSGWGVGSEESNGFEVGGAQGYGLFVGHAGMDGVYVGAADNDGVYVSSAGNPSGSGISTYHNGFEVSGAEGHGLFVGKADLDGVKVFVAGNPSAIFESTQHNGFEVPGAEGYGLYVGRADLDGVYVNSTAWHGLNVAGAGVDGLYVSSAGSDGVDVAGGAYAGNFHGDIYVSGDCIGCSTAVFGLNAGDQPLEPGQIVAIQGIEGTTLDNTSVLWRVVPAGEGAAAVGVVRGKAELDEAPEGTTLRQGETGRRLVPRSGAAEPGGYLTIVIYGPMQVQVSTADGAIEPGTRLAVGQGGGARALKTVVVQGLTLAESVPTVGIALAAPDEDGLVWVLVNPQ